MSGTREEAARRARNSMTRILLRIETASIMVAADVSANHGEAAGKIVQGRFEELVRDLVAERAIHDAALEALA